MDIIRIKTKKNHIYKHIKNGNILKNKKMLNHIKSLRIPPAYNHVLINSDINAKVLAISTDTKNRKQYTYNPEYVEEQKEIKFCDLIYFGRKIKRIRKDILNHLSQDDRIPSKETVISLILFIVDKCNFRIGNEKYKHLYDTYGVSTLNCNHVKINENKISISFVGKKSVFNKGQITHPLALKQFKKLHALYNSFDYLFYYKDKKNGEIYRITEKHVNQFLKKYSPRLIVKMYRTWSANQMVLSELINSPRDLNETQLNKNFLLIIKKVAKKMHHTTNVSKKNYVNNELIDFYVKHNKLFFNFIDSLKKNSGQLPTIDKILNHFLKRICNK